MAKHLPPNLRMLDTEKLAEMIGTSVDRLLVIDSRSFVEYNTSHVLNSVNIVCSKLVKRRLQQDKVTIRELLSNSCKVDTDDNCEVVVYDQCTHDASGIQSENFLSVLLGKLSGTFQRVSLLTGGFAAFQSCFPSLCETQGNFTKCSALAPLSQPCMSINNVGPTKILAFLYLGSQKDVLNQEVMHTSGIEYVLNISKTCPQPDFLPDAHFCRIPVNDNYTEKIIPYMDQAMEFIEKVQSSNGKVIVHCLAGVSRSATVAIAYVMRYLHMSSDDAYRYVKDKRPTISPNFNFLGQLLEYEKLLRKDKQGPDYVITDQPHSRPSGCGDVITPKPRSPSPYRETKPYLFHDKVHQSETDDDPTERKRSKVSPGVKIRDIPAIPYVVSSPFHKTPERPTGLDVVSQLGPIFLNSSPPPQFTCMTVPNLPSPSTPDSIMSSPMQDSPPVSICSKPSGKPVSPVSLQQVHDLTGSLSVNSPGIKYDNPFHAVLRKKNAASVKNIDVDKPDSSISVAGRNSLLLTGDQSGVVLCGNVADSVTHKPATKPDENCGSSNSENAFFKTVADTVCSNSENDFLKTVADTDCSNSENAFLKTVANTNCSQASKNSKGSQQMDRSAEAITVTEKKKPRKANNVKVHKSTVDTVVHKDSQTKSTKHSVRESFSFSETSAWTSAMSTQCDFMRIDGHAAKLQRSSGSVESLDCHYQEIMDIDDTGATLGSQRSMCGSCEMIEVS
ncbi:uncharacterized protein LOC100366454 [Saccoglossus kowalevskii]|uniref:protein-tyrosine-phosphatase n=1 Tax=Saccoglossus kowalevskii TaxID=10224 RepID=A0ABM0GPM1_SACKO|nr:PREDICTED: dual specificity protein phosphatase 8-like [Saccoglossus kowalevskii]